MQELAQKIVKADRKERTTLTRELNKKQLERLCKILGLKSEGHAVQLRNNIIYNVR